MEALVECDVAPWVFDVSNLLDLKLMKRAAGDVTIEVDPQVARDLRSRSVRDLELQCA